MLFNVITRLKRVAARLAGPKLKPKPKRGRVAFVASKPRRHATRWRKSAVIPVAISWLAWPWSRNTRVRPSARVPAFINRFKRNWRSVLIGVVALLLIVAAGVTFALFYPGGLLASLTAKPTITGSPGFDNTLLGCVRGATSAALSAAVPAAPLAATGVLVPGSAVLVAAATVIGCGIGAVSTTSTSGVEWLLINSRSWFSGLLGT
ncbi:MAG: hypothetical protein WCK65_10530 [Rhodospirillaceae bacterium]